MVKGGCYCLDGEHRALEQSDFRLSQMNKHRLMGKKRTVSRREATVLQLSGSAAFVKRAGSCIVKRQLKRMEFIGWPA